MSADIKHFENIIKRRKDFPSLNREHNGIPLAYFDGPGGTQIPQAVIDSIVNYYKNSNSNTHGFFITTNETDAVIAGARKAMAEFLNAEGGHTISFGANMTSLNFSLSKGIARYLQPGDEILITQLDHEANRGPWLSLRENGIIVREVKLKADGRLDYDDFKEKINEDTRLVALGMASNALGTVNDIKQIRELTYKTGAWLLVDAVHYAPHFPIDVQKLGVDFLLCSVYKFYGPHVGVLYSKEGMLDMLQTDRLRTQEQHAPFSIETGTQNHAAFSGVSAAVDFIASFGEGKERRDRIVSSMQKIGEYEHYLAVMLYEGLLKIPGIKIYGPDFSSTHRAPTISFSLEGKNPVEVCTALGEKAICAWDGHFYALRAIEVLGLLEKGGVTRVGVSLYNTVDEVNRFLDNVKKIASAH